MVQIFFTTYKNYKQNNQAQEINDFAIEFPLCVIVNYIKVYFIFKGHIFIYYAISCVRAMTHISLTLQI